MCVNNLTRAALDSGAAMSITDSISATECHTLGQWVVTHVEQSPFTVAGLCDTSLSINLSNSVTRGSCLKLVKPTCSSDIRQYFFASRVIDVWNYLNDDIVKSPSFH